MSILHLIWIIPLSFLLGVVVGIICTISVED